MPFVTVKMIEGRNAEIKRNVCESVAIAVSKELNLPKQNVIVLIEEMSKENYYINGELFADKK